MRNGPKRPRKEWAVHAVADDRRSLDGGGDDSGFLCGLLDLESGEADRREGGLESDFVGRLVGHGGLGGAELSGLHLVLVDV